MRYTVPASRLWKRAELDALDLRHDYLVEEHLVLAMIHEGCGQAGAVLAQLGPTADAVRAWIAERYPPTPYRKGVGNPYGPKMKEAVETAERLALVSGRQFVSTADLLLGLLADPDGPASTMLSDLGVDPKSVQARTHETSTLQEEPVPAELRAPSPARMKLRRALRRPFARPRRWLLTRNGVTSPLMDNWGSVNVRFVNNKVISGTLAGQPFALRVRRTKRAEGTLGSDTITLTWSTLNRQGAIEAELSGTLGLEPMHLKARLCSQADPDAHMGRAFSDATVAGRLSGSAVLLEHMPHVGTFGTGPSRLIGLKGTVGSEELSLMISTHGDLRDFGSLWINGRYSSEEFHLHGRLLPRTAHIYGSFDGPPTVVLPIVLAALQVLTH